MLSVLIASMVATIPSGALTLTSLCQKLTDATGVVHRVDPRLVDYPLYISVRDGDPSKVEKIVAKVMRATWSSNDKVLELTPAPIDPAEELAAFTSELQESSPPFSQLPPKALFDLAPGSMMRFANMPGFGVKPLPKQVAGVQEGIRQFITVRRFTRGVFETSFAIGETSKSVFSDGAQIEFRHLRPPVTKALGDRLAASLPAGEGHPFGDLVTAARTDFGKGGDLVVSLVGTSLDGIAEAANRDVAIVLPDYVVFAVSDLEKPDRTLQSVLEAFSQFVYWQVSDEDLVGTLPYIETKASSQTKRDVLRRYVRSAKSMGTMEAKSLSDYVRNQRLGASNTWTDAMLLTLAGAAMDQTYLGDYPHNLRLYTVLSAGDWRLIRSGEPFLVSQMSSVAQANLRTLLVQSRNALMDEESDPAFWPSLSPNQLSITPSLVDETVLRFQRAEGEPMIETVASAAAHYRRQASSGGSEILFTPGTRTKLELTVRCLPSDEEHATGFAEFKARSGAVPVKWKDLPEPLRSEFERNLNVPQESEGILGGGP